MNGLWSNAGAKGPSHGRDGAHRQRLGSTLGSAVLASLLLCEVVAAMVGAEAVHFSIIVGLENVLDAGCIFMLISLGVVVVVGVASHGAGSLLA